VTTKNLNFRAPPALAIAEGATTPDPGIMGVSVWSTTLLKPVVWTGSLWTAYTGGVARAQNRSLAAQTLPAATATYIAGSALALPAAGLVVGSCFRWTFSLAKTAAGVAASTVSVRIGTAGTVADAAVLTFTKPVGTAVADEGKIVVEMVVRSIGATGVVAGEFTMTHKFAATGHMTVPAFNQVVISAGFSTTAATQVGLAITTGAADVCDIQLCMAEAWAL
jgi:hypothetical protein